MTQFKADLFEYVIMGKPIPLQRPRFTKGHIWDSQKEQKRLDWHIIRQQHGERSKYVGPLQIDIEFVFYHKANLSHHSSRPDVDNTIKYILDVCQLDELLFVDDCQVAIVTARKTYGPVAQTKFKIRELNDGNH